MKIENIKTMQEFYDFADVWYQRTHKLRSFSQDETQTTAKREKAYLLFNIMSERVMRLTQVAIEVNETRPQFKKGS